jgi:two-component system chemotaxis response regulator CheV
VKTQEILLETGTNELEILEFFLLVRAEETDVPERLHFGINVAKVMQVIESPRLPPLPHAPNPSFLGTIPLRDHILPLIDLGRFMELARERTDFEVVIVTEFSQAITGFLVSGVTEIHRVSWEEVVPPSGYFGRFVTGSLIGTVQRDDHFIQMLDLETILAEMDPASMQLTGFEGIRGSGTYRALVADDSPTIRVMLRDNLRKASLLPQLVGNGQEALAALEEIRRRAHGEARKISEFVDVVIADIEMPLMDGFSLTKWIKADPDFGGLPVILYSSIITKELGHKGVAVGADLQVSKPEMCKMAQKAIELIEGRGRPAT